MHEWQSRAHVRWECKYHVVIIPKYRRKVLHGRVRHRIGAVLRQLCEQRDLPFVIAPSGGFPMGSVRPSGPS